MITHLKGNPVNTSGDMPARGESAPEFNLTATDLSLRTLADFKGKKVVLNIFPSLDTGVCAASVRRFNALASGLQNTVVLCISRDLPFAHNRFCTTEGLQNVVSLSEMRSLDFGQDYGLRMIDGPLAGLLARSVLVLDALGRVVYTELVPEITQEPDYDSAIAAL
ncbi:MAG TPA: thiol peroxidase [Bacteroidales bacterium]|nr:thiol peroxidase [Bacteroidales bacterium]